MSATFEPPLILDAASRPSSARRRDAILTLLLWAGWLYLLVAATGTLWVPPFVQHLLPIDPPERPWEVIRIALFNLGIAALLCICMLMRVLRERRRFAGDDRRLGFARPEPTQVAVALRAPPAELPAWRAARRLVVHHDAEGSVIGVETGA